MPPYKSQRPVSEIDPSIAEEVGAATGRNLAVTLLAQADGGTEILFHDRDNPGATVDLASEVVESVVTNHRRPPRPVDIPPAAPASPPVFTPRPPEANVNGPTSVVPPDPTPLGRPDRVRS